MKTWIYMATLLTASVGCDAQSAAGLAALSLVDRDTGAVISPHRYHGEWWVAGKAGGRYAIEIQNRLGERLLAVTSVDGVNVLSGATAAWDQTGYVFGAGERYQIAGWRKSDTEIAAFTFADLPNSYAALTGRPGDVGVIGVALFRERQPEPVVDGWLESASKAAAGNDSSAARRNRAESAAAHAAAAPAQLGTGHGEREYSRVSHTEFERLRAEPDEVIRIRYDSLDNLVAMGIIATITQSSFEATKSRLRYARAKLRELLLAEPA